MAGARLTATFKADEFRGAIRHLAEQLHDTAPLMRSIGERMVRNTSDRMEGSTDATGKAWAPLQPAYAAIKRGPGILRESLQLQKSLTFYASSGHVVWGSNVIYAAVQQFGGKIVPKNAKALVFRFGSGGGIVRAKSVTLPARPYLGLDGEDQRQVVGIAQGAIQRALGGGRLG